jgi:hypothetical protein
MDVCGPFGVSTRGNRYILTVLCLLTRYLVAVPLQSVSGEEIARAFLDHVILQYGCPMRIVTDCAPNLTRGMMAALRDTFQISSVTVTPFHPQANGAIERVHQTIGDMLRKSVDENGRNWDDTLAFVRWVYLTNAHDSLGGDTPFHVSFGWHPRWPTDLTPMSPVPVSDAAAALRWPQLRDRVATLWQKAKMDSARASQRREVYSETRPAPPTFPPGSLVWLYVPTVSRAGVRISSKKLRSSWVGPYGVLGERRRNVFALTSDWDPTTRRVLDAHVDRLRPYVSLASRPLEDVPALEALVPPVDLEDLPVHDRAEWVEEEAYPGAAVAPLDEALPLEALRQEQNRFHAPPPALLSSVPLAMAPPAVNTDLSEAPLPAVDSDEWEVERVVRHRGPPASREYLVRWRGFVADADSWVAADDILPTAPLVVEAYWRAHEAHQVEQQRREDRSTLRRSDRLRGRRPK